MMPFFSRTGTGRTIRATHAAGWGILVSARGVWRTEGFAPDRAGGDNGAWTSSEEFKRGARSTPDPCLKTFDAFVTAMAGKISWLVVPDIVQGGERSWAMTRYWLRKLRRDRRCKGMELMIAVQDGFDFDMVAPFLGPRVGVFVGGSTEWKLRTMRQWRIVAHARGATCHVARVNTVKRIRQCARAKVDRIDGSSVTRFLDTLPLLDGAVRAAVDFVQRQGELFEEQAA